jgi:hypothetical protein
MIVFIHERLGKYSRTYDVEWYNNHPQLSDNYRVMKGMHYGEKEVDAMRSAYLNYKDYVNYDR